MGIIEVVLIICELIVAFRSRANRKARRDAKSAGQPIPKRDVWAILYLVLFFLIFTIGAAMLAFWLSLT